MDKEIALKILRELHDKALFSDRTALETFIPELKESEYERIRKALIKYFTLSDDNADYQCCGVHYKDIVAWLEKQREQTISENYKQAEKEKRDAVGYGFMLCKGDILDFKEGESYWLEYIGDDKYNVRSDNLLGKTYHLTPMQFYLCFRPLTWLEKQGDTSEIVNKKKIASDILRGAAINLITWIDYNAAEGNMCLSNMECKDIEDALVSGDWDKIYAYIKKKLEKQGEQKPVNDTDEDIVEAVKDTSILDLVEPKFHEGEWVVQEKIGVYKVIEVTAKRYKDGLLKLAKQGEQKPAEWGEEDETTFKVMLEELEKYVMFKQYSTPLSVYDLQWFKSLKDRVQPQPKQEWSVEDETGWTNTMIMIKEVASNHYTKDSIKLVIDWLKSLKERIGG